MSDALALVMTWPVMSARVQLNLNEATAASSLERIVSKSEPAQLKTHVLFFPGLLGRNTFCNNGMITPLKAHNREKQR